MVFNPGIIGEHEKESIICVRLVFMFGSLVIPNGDFSFHLDTYDTDIFLNCCLKGNLV